MHTELLLGDVMHADGRVRLLANIQIGKQDAEKCDWRTTFRDGSSTKKKRIARYQTNRRGAMQLRYVYIERRKQQWPELNYKLSKHVLTFGCKYAELGHRTILESIKSKAKTRYQLAAAKQRGSDGNEFTCNCWKRCFLRRPCRGII